MKPFYTFNSFCHEERKNGEFFFRNHVVMRWLDLRFFYGGETNKREGEREKMNPAIAHVTKKRGKILLHQIMVKFAHKCLSYTLARGEMNVIFFPIPKLQYN